MKYLLLFIGLVCYIIGLCLYFTQDVEKTKDSKKFVLIGGLLIIANCFYLSYSINNKIGDMIPIIVLVICFIPITIGHFQDGGRFIFGTLVILAVTLLIIFGGKLPSVTLDNNIIEMSGRYGGNFKISEIQSADTVSVYPRVYRIGGYNGPQSHYGNFDMQYEKKPAKLCIYLNNPPYIKIRMTDNSLFILNFKEPDETVEFYNELINALNN